MEQTGKIILTIGANEVAPPLSYDTRDGVMWAHPKMVTVGKLQVPLYEMPMMAAHHFLRYEKRARLVETAPLMAMVLDDRGYSVSKKFYPCKFATRQVVTGEDEDGRDIKELVADWVEDRDWVDGDSFVATVKVTKAEAAKLKAEAEAEAARVAEEKRIADEAEAAK